MIEDNCIDILLPAAKWCLSPCPFPTLRSCATYSETCLMASTCTHHSKNEQVHPGHCLVICFVERIELLANSPGVKGLSRVHRARISPGVRGLSLAAFWLPKAHPATHKASEEGPHSGQTAVGLGNWQAYLLLQEVSLNEVRHLGVVGLLRHLVQRQQLLVGQLLEAQGQLHGCTCRQGTVRGETPPTRTGTQVTETV